MTLTCISTRAAIMYVVTRLAALYFLSGALASILLPLLTLSPVLTNAISWLYEPVFVSIFTVW